jgi:hypothetical protein
MFALMVEPVGPTRVVHTTSILSPTMTQQPYAPPPLVRVSINEASRPPFGHGAFSRYKSPSFVVIGGDAAAAPVMTMNAMDVMIAFILNPSEILFRQNISKRL